MTPHAFDRFPVLETPRLLLRAPVSADAGDLLALRGDAEITRYQMIEAPPDIDAARAQINRWRKRFELRAEIRWIITSREDGSFVGISAYSFLVPALDRGHVVYEVARRAWGRGIATEALAAMVAWGHEKAGLNRIEAVVIPGNEASARVLQKVGFTEEGLMRAYGRWHGRYHDMRMFSITRPGARP